MDFKTLSEHLARAGYSIVKRKDQESSQYYEWSYCKGELEDSKLVSDYFSSIDHNDLRANFIFNEFCAKNEFLYEQIKWHCKDRVVLEIGPSWAPMIPFLPARQRIFIEPLANKIEEYVLAHYGRSVYSCGRIYSCYADTYIPELQGAVDGLIYIRNCIDHSPNWVFILSNLTSYSSLGCKLMLWNDIDHSGGPNDGHYNVTPSKPTFLRLIENLGFRIDQKFAFCDRESTNLGIVATKVNEGYRSLHFNYSIREFDPNREVSFE